MSSRWWWLFIFRGTCNLSFCRCNFRHSKLTMVHWKLSTSFLCPCPSNKHQVTASMYFRSRSRRRLPRTSTSAFDKVITASAASGASLGPWGCSLDCRRSQVAANAPAQFSYSKLVWRSTRFVLMYARYFRTPGIWRPLYSMHVLNNSKPLNWYFHIFRKNTIHSFMIPS